MKYDTLLLAYARKGLFKPLRKSAFRKFCRRNRGLSDIVTTHHGLKINAIVGDSVDNAIFVNRMYEEATSRVIQKLSAECSCFIDVGCNIGYYSCLYGVSNPTGSVYCMDPNSEMIRRTEENLKLNGITDYRLFPIAAGSTVCTMTLNIPEDRHSLSSLAYIPKRGDRTANRAVQVDVVPLKDIIEKHQLTNALLKIDAEGFEYQVFGGLNDAAVEGVNYIIFELSARNLERAGTSMAALLSFDWMKCFDFFRISDENGSVIKETPEILIANNTSANILLAPKAKPFLQPL